MKNLQRNSRYAAWSLAFLLSAMAAGCGEGRDPILGFGAFSGSTPPIVDTTRPRVTATQPDTTSPGPTAGVPANTAIAAVFTEEMDPATITAAGNFTVTCAAACVSPTTAGTVSYSAGTRTATFTPTTPPLETAKTYTVTIKGTGVTPVTDLAGNALAGNTAPLPAASDYVWSFTTVAPVAPAAVTVASTNPAASATGVCPGASINATFTDSGFRMDPATVNTMTFTLTGPGPGSPLAPVTAQSVVLDDATGLTATFKPQSNLAAGTYTATIESGASGVKDLAVPANQMISDVTWTFVVDPAAANCATQSQLQLIDLGSAATFGTTGGNAGMTNDGLRTVINGDIGTTGASTSVTGFHDNSAPYTPPPMATGCSYTETALNSGVVNGKIYTAAPPPTVSCPDEGTAETFAIARQAREDALAAYNYLAGLAGGCASPCGDNGDNLGGLTLPPRVYRAPNDFFLVTGTDLTLDGNGDANAVWVFQMASSLTVGAPGTPGTDSRSVILINGAQAKNVYWQVGSAATINPAGGGTMVGTIIAEDGAEFSTAGNLAPEQVVTLNGRVLSLGASVTIVNTVINVPSP